MSTPGYGSERKSSGESSVLWIIAGIGCAALLLLVVPVIGILAAIAIPNFLKFQCRAKGAEARTNLAGLYVAEKSFFAEYNTYSTDLVAVNWTPDGSPNYVYGFARPGPGIRPSHAAQAMSIPDYDESRSDTANPAVIAKGNYLTSRMQDEFGHRLTGADLPAEATAGDNAFLAAAVGDIDHDSTPQYDIWTVDEQRLIMNVQKDCDR